MSQCLKIRDDHADFITAENLDYVEDKLIGLCEDMKRDGVHLLELTSALIFVTHFLLSEESNDVAARYYRFLSKQCQEQIDALHEFYELPKGSKQKY